MVLGMFEPYHEVQAGLWWGAGTLMKLSTGPLMTGANSYIYNSKGALPGVRCGDAMSGIARRCQPACVWRRRTINLRSFSAHNTPLASSNKGSKVAGASGTV